MSDTGRLVEFVLAQIADDEAAARAAMRVDSEGRWTFGDSYGVGIVVDDINEIVVYDEGMPTDEQAAHIARHDPARVLADCAAKRAIVELHAITVSKVEVSLFDPDTGERRTPEHEVDCVVCGWASDDPTSACDTVRLLAQPYAGRPGWDPEWKVET